LTEKNANQAVAMKAFNRNALLLEILL